MINAQRAARRIANQQSQIPDGCQLRESAGHGHGVFATRPFAPGDLVMAGVVAEVLDKNNSHACQIGKDRFVLLAGLFNLVNHSCDPNCGLRGNAIGAYDLAAIRHIDANEQVTFDYAMGNYSIDHFSAMCLCGSASCRGRITGWKDLPEERKIAYEGFVAPYLLELDACASPQTETGHD